MTHQGNINIQCQAAGSMDEPITEKTSLRCRHDPQLIITSYAKGLFPKPEGFASKSSADRLAPIKEVEILSH